MKQPPAWYDSNADNPPWIKALAGWAYVRGLVFGCPTALPHGERLLQRQELRRLIWRLTNEPTIACYLVRRLRFIPWRYSWRMGVAPFFGTDAEGGAEEAATALRADTRDLPKRSQRPICPRETVSMSSGSSVSPSPDDSIPRAGRQTTHTVARSRAEGPSHRCGSPKCRPRPDAHPEPL